MVDRTGQRHPEARGRMESGAATAAPLVRANEKGISLNLWGESGRVISALTDPGVNKQRQQLPTLNEFKVEARLVNLHIEQKPTSPQNVFGVDKA